MMGGQSTYAPRVLLLGMPTTWPLRGNLYTLQRRSLSRWRRLFLFSPMGRFDRSLSCVLFVLIDTCVIVIEEIRTPIEATSSHTSTPRASHFPPVQMHDASTDQPSPPVPELIPDIYPVATRGCAPPPILGVREELPPRPFSTPPRINSRGEAATSVKTCVAWSLYGQVVAVLMPCSSL